jgi:hypothetical protein
LQIEGNYGFLEEKNTSDFQYCITSNPPKISMTVNITNYRQLYLPLSTSAQLWGRL